MVIAPEHKRATYTTLLTSGKLNSYLADIDEQAEERFERLIEDMKLAQGISEQLKAENTLEWVGRMSNIQASAVEIINSELIFK
ncbi:MAG: TnpV protein [Lachnospiraceae bacterium]|nr:TnpV protein [Lachnospiraceae bacterium]